MNGTTRRNPDRSSFAVGPLCGMARYSPVYSWGFAVAVGEGMATRGGPAPDEGHARRQPMAPIRIGQGDSGPGPGGGTGGDAGGPTGGVSLTGRFWGWFQDKAFERQYGVKPDVATTLDEHTREQISKVLPEYRDTVNPVLQLIRGQDD